MNSTEKSIIEKIKKLLSLATSANEHESKLAADKANTLLLKYNLSRSEIKDRDYEKSEIASEPYIRPHMKFVVPLLSNFFHVEAVLDREFRGFTVDGRRKFKHKVNIYGEQVNVEVATYVYDFLCNEYQALWLKYKRENGLKERGRLAYYVGLTKGIKEMLKSTQVKVSEEMGLVVVKDGGIMDWLKGQMKLATRPMSGKYHKNDKAVNDGYKDGKNVKIRRGVSTNNKSAKILKLSKGGL